MKGILIEVATMMALTAGALLLAQVKDVTAGGGQDGTDAGLSRDDFVRIVRSSLVVPGKESSGGVVGLSLSDELLRAYRIVCDRNCGETELRESVRREWGRLFAALACRDYDESTAVDGWRPAGYCSPLPGFQPDGGYFSSLKNAAGGAGGRFGAVLPAERVALINRIDRLLVTGDSAEVGGLSGAEFHVEYVLTGESPVRLIVEYVTGALSRAEAEEWIECWREAATEKESAKAAAHWGNVVKGFFSARHPFVDVRVRVMGASGALDWHFAEYHIQRGSDEEGTVEVVQTDLAHQLRDKMAKCVDKAEITLPQFPQAVYDGPRYLTEEGFTEVMGHEAEIRRGRYELCSQMGAKFARVSDTVLAARAEAGGPWLDEDVRRKLSLNQCTGCHGGEVRNYGRVHIAIDDSSGNPLALSAFLGGEMRPGGEWRFRQSELFRRIKVLNGLFSLGKGAPLEKWRDMVESYSFDPGDLKDEDEITKHALSLQSATEDPRVKVWLRARKPLFRATH